jgi:hypothetical protein
MDLVGALTVAVATLGILAAAATIISIIIIARRNRQPAAIDVVVREVELRAGSALVRLDDLIHDSEDELGFAIAQFGEADTAEFADAIRAAKQIAREAFALRQRLDDAVPDSERQRREWNRRIITLCESATEVLTEHKHDFDFRRGREQNAPQDLQRVRMLIEATRGRIEAPDVSAPAAPAALLADASAAANRAEGLLGGRVPVGPVIREAEQSAARAARILDAAARAERDAAQATLDLNTLVDELRASILEARAVRDTHPEPDQRDAVNETIAEVEAELGATDRTAADDGPRAAIDRLQRVGDRLDTALAGARSAERRLEQARAALTGALRQAESHIQAAADYIAAHRGQVGTNARTRLAEAERQLTLAREEADPVAALDAARRASTRAMDADALARYDTMQH